MGQFRHWIELYPLEAKLMKQTHSQLSLGLCCQFSAEPIKFRTTTVISSLRLSKQQRLEKLSTLCLSNANALMDALKYCALHKIGAFRINSQILPVKTHPEAGYDITELPDSHDIVAQFQACGTFAQSNNL